MSTTLNLPIELEDLPPSTRSWIITKSAAEGIDTKRLTHDLLVAAAEQDGFKEKPIPPEPRADLTLNSSPILASSPVDLEEQASTPSVGPTDQAPTP